MQKTELTACDISCECGQSSVYRTPLAQVEDLDKAAVEGVALGTDSSPETNRGLCWRRRRTVCMCECLYP